jgi:hypothetical protein
MHYGYAPEPRKRHTARTVILSIAGALIVLIVLGAVLGGGTKPGAPAAAASSTPAAAAAHKAAAPHVIAKFTGSGIENTAKFATPGTWTLKWAYNCTSTGSTGNFIVSEDGGLGGVNVNELGVRGHGTTHGYSDAGRHYLEVDSECAWKVRVFG